MIGYEGKIWVFYFWFVGWDCFSLGLHFCASAPNIEIHLPFGFIRMGKRSWIGAPYDGWSFRKNENSWG